VKTILHQIIAVALSTLVVNKRCQILYAKWPSCLVYVTYTGSINQYLKYINYSIVICKLEVILHNSNSSRSQHCPDPYLNWYPMLLMPQGILTNLNNSICYEENTVEPLLTTPWIKDPRIEKNFHDKDKKWSQLFKSKRGKPAKKWPNVYYRQDHTVDSNTDTCRLWKQVAALSLVSIKHFYKYTKKF